LVVGTAQLTFMKRTVARSRISALGMCGLNDQSKLSSVWFA